jgi:hypothetical protein
MPERVTCREHNCVSRGKPFRLFIFEVAKMTISKYEYFSLYYKYVIESSMKRCDDKVHALTLRHNATSRKVAGSKPDDMNNFYQLPNPSGGTRAWDLLSLQQKWVPEPEIKMFLGSGAWPARDVHNLTTISEPIVLRMWDPQHLTIL